jgi:hypothetical protein
LQELAFVFGNPTGGPTEKDPDRAVCIVADESAAGARLAALIPALWTSFAITGTPHADPSLFTVGGDAVDQWPACGPDATVGHSSNEPVLVLGATMVGIEHGRKDDDCALMHEHIKQVNSNLWPWLKGFFVCVIFVGAAVGAIVNHKLPDPRQPLPEKVTCEGPARVSVTVTLAVSLCAALLPWIAPHGSIPFVLAVCCACALLARDPRVVVATSIVAFFVGLWHIELLVRDHKQSAAASLETVIWNFYWETPVHMCSSYY